MSERKPILMVVDDDDEIRSQLKWALVSDYEVVVAGDRLSALETAHKHRPGVVLLDLGLPPSPGTPEEGFATLTHLLAQDPSVKVIIISGQSERENAVQAVGEGAYDFLAKPVDVDSLKLMLRRAFHVGVLEREYQELRHSQRSESAFEGMLGTSPQMCDVFTRIRKVATSDAPVLILGESGTGKEMAALAIHRRSPRKSKPFVAINCGAIPETLLESELFGHEKGAFTGAHAQRKGRVEMADGGTLFLDEIGELSPQLQVKLLRFLQEQTIERVGGRGEIKVDVRVISATNIDMDKALESTRFREDLYYRLAVVIVRLPALRERVEDIPLLAKAFLQRFAGEVRRKSISFSPQALLAMQHYPWTGNVRELENRVKRAVIMAEDKVVTSSDLELPQLGAANRIRTLREAREETERAMIEQALGRHNRKISPAAAELGISRPTLYELMEKLGMSRLAEKE